MRQVAEGIAEAITLTLNRYDLTDQEYEDLLSLAISQIDYVGIATRLTDQGGSND